MAPEMNATMELKMFMQEEGKLTNVSTVPAEEYELEDGEMLWSEESSSDSEEDDFDAINRNLDSSQ